MTTFQIKLLALLFMVFDHLGYFFFPNSLELRLLGRLSFPLFAWLIANGAVHTKNITKYFYRLVIFAFATQIPFYFANKIIDSHTTLLNIFFTLALGLAVIMCIKKTKNKSVWTLCILIGCTLAQLINADYGAFGILIIVIFYIFYHRFFVMAFLQLFIFVLHSLYSVTILNPVGMVEFVGLLSLVFLYFYNKKQGPKMQYFFYLFYPMQYLVVLAVKYLF